MLTVDKTDESFAKGGSFCQFTYIFYFLSIPLRDNVGLDAFSSCNRNTFQMVIFAI